MDTPREDLEKMLQARDLLEDAFEKVRGLTPHASTRHGPPDPNLPPTAAFLIDSAIREVEREIEALERMLGSRY